jgi:hypothetical protein
MITTALAIAQTILIFTLGYLTAKLVRRIKDQILLDEIHSRVCAKILESELMKKEMLKDVKIDVEVNENA